MKTFPSIDEFWSKYLKIKDIIDNPVIIGYNCGYKDDPELKLYSKETMQHCMKVADYLEIYVTNLKFQEQPIFNLLRHNVTNDGLADKR